MKWQRANEHDFDYCHLLPEKGEIARLIVVAAAGSTRRGPKATGEQWHPMVDVTMDNVHSVFPEICRRRRVGYRELWVGTEMAALEFRYPPDFDSLIRSWRSG